MGALGERIDRQQAARVVDAHPRLAALEAGGDQGVEGRQGRLPQPLLGGQQPLLEGGAVADEEAAQEVADVEAGGPAELLRIGMGAGQAPLGGALEVGDVEPDRQPRVEPHGLALAVEQLPLEPGRGERGAQAVEDLAQIAAGGALCAIRPKQPGDPLPAHRLPGVHRQVGEQPAGLLRLEPAHRGATAADLEAAEETDFDIGHERALSRPANGCLSAPRRQRSNASSSLRLPVAESSSAPARWASGRVDPGPFRIDGNR